MDIGNYKHFLPYCVDSRQLESNNGILRMAVTVGFGLFTETYVSQVTYDRPLWIKVRWAEIELIMASSSSCRV